MLAFQLNLSEKFPVSRMNPPRLRIPCYWDATRPDSEKRVVMRLQQAKRAACALLTGALGAATLFCARHAGQTLPLQQSFWAAGSFLADPAAATVAALHTMDDLLPRPPEPEVPAEAAAPPVSQPADVPTPEPAPTAAPAPDPGPAPEGAGKIISSHYGNGQGDNYIPCGAGTVRNCTSLARSEVEAIIAQGLPFSIEANSSEPQVLIMHTHTTESYEDMERPWYHPDATSRTTDETRNVVAVGAAMAQQLNAAGVCTIQDTTLHDYPSYNGSYERSNATVRRLLQEHPSIKVVLDVHRDAIIQQDGTWVKPVADLADQGPCAQVMLICGADRGGNLPNFRQNLRFAAAWQRAMTENWPGLARPVLFDYRYYNQDLTTGSLLIEVGGHANTLEEAVNAGTLAGKALAKALLGQ